MVELYFLEAWLTSNRSYSPTSMIGAGWPGTVRLIVHVIYKGFRVVELNPFSTSVCVANVWFSSHTFKLGASLSYFFPLAITASFVMFGRIIVVSSSVVNGIAHIL